MCLRLWLTTQPPRPQTLHGLVKPWFSLNVEKYLLIDMNNIDNPQTFYTAPTRIFLFRNLGVPPNMSLHCIQPLIYLEPRARTWIHT